MILLDLYNLENLVVNLRDLSQFQLNISFIVAYKKVIFYFGDYSCAVRYIVEVSFFSTDYQSVFRSFLLSDRLVI